MISSDTFSLISIDRFSCARLYLSYMICKSFCISSQDLIELKRLINSDLNLIHFCNVSIPLFMDSIKIFPDNPHPNPDALPPTPFNF